MSTVADFGLSDPRAQAAAASATGAASAPNKNPRRDFIASFMGYSAQPNVNE
jgi:hypothetical protein